MKKIILISALMFSFNGWAYEITKEVAIAKLHEFFFLLDVDNYKKESFSKIVAKDFQIFEDGGDFDLDSALIGIASLTIVQQSHTGPRSSFS